MSHHAPWLAHARSKPIDAPRWRRRVSRSMATLALVGLTLSALVAPPAAAAADPIEGVDISHWQGEIDWTQVAGADKRFAFMKATEDDDYIDPTYGLNRARAKQNGIKVGAYHFAQPSTAKGDAVAEADHFLSVAVIEDGDLPPVLDLEGKTEMTDAQIQSWVRAWLERVRARTGIHAAIYVSPNWWLNAAGDTPMFAREGWKTLWVAHWTTAAEPRVPAGDWAGYGWTFWQVTNSGAVPGISGRVDLDVFRGTDLGTATLDGVGEPTARVSDTPFRDISDSKFRYDIAWLYTQGITSGCSATRFCPDGKVTRGQMASFLARALDLPKTSKDYFRDDESSVHEGYINRIAKAGLTSGCGGGRYCPNEVVTRAQLASFLARVLDLSATSRDYFDDDDSSTHESNINRIARAGLTGGCGTRRYCPNQALTRGQMAAFLHRTFDD